MSTFTFFIKRSPLLIINFIVFTKLAVAQASISGPTCVNTGIQYQYTISGNWNTSTNMNWCLTGGVISGTTNTCKSGTPVVSILVVWNGGVTSGVVSLTSSIGNATLNVTVVPALQPGAINASSKTQNINYNSIPVAINCSVATNGSCFPSYSYQWQQSLNSVNWTSITSQTSQNLSLSSPLTQTTYYRRMVTETTSSSVDYSDIATVYVYPQLVSSIAPTSKTINYNTGPGQLTNTRSGGNGTYTYQWQTSTNNSTWNNISGATQNYTPGNLILTTYYRVITSSNGVPVTSNTSTITVYPQIIPGSISPSALTINYNASPGQLTGTTPSGGNGTYNYQWQSSVDNTNWTNINGATALNYTPGNQTATKYFRRATISNGATGYSNTSTITVYAQLIAGTLSPLAIALNYGDDAGWISGTDATGGNGTYTYQWQSSANNSTWSDISGAIGLSYSPGIIYSPIYYRRKVSSNGANAFTASVQIILPLYGGVIGSDVSAVSSGGSANLLNVNAASGGNCGGSAVYQWQKSSDELNWTDILSPTITGLTSSTYYRRKATCGSQTAYSNTILIKVQTPSATTIIPNTSVSSSAGTQTVINMPTYQSTVDPLNVNYIKSRTFTRPGIATQIAADAVSSNQDVQQSTTYFDGLGRDMQTVTKQATPLGKDVISTNFYDQFGRVVQQYLPYTDNLNSGNFRTDAATKQPAFYNTYLSNTESYYYSNTVYEASPLNKVIKTTAPGKSWTGKNIGVSILDRTNDLYDSVRIWNIDFTSASTPTSVSTCLPSSLYVHETTDENNNKIIEYKDKEGHIILKKVQIADALLPGHKGWLCTYYVYDDLGNLRFVIPPKATEALQGRNWVFESTKISSSTIAKELCFAYEYDERGRMIIKRVPGAGPVWMVYDARDRVVMTQDSSLRKLGKWLYTDYDSLNRPILTGLWTTTGDLNYHQAFADTSIIYPNPPANASNEVLTETYYDNYSWSSSVTLPFSGTSVDNSNTNNTSYFYTPDNTSYPYPQSLVSSNLTIGMVTGTKVKIIGSASNYLYSVNFYDDRGRLIQVKRTNIDGGYDVGTTQFDFSSKALRVLETHKKTTTTIQHTVLSKMEYDAGGRLLKIYKKVDNSQETMIEDNQYDEQGKLKTKKIGQDRNSDYTYNGTKLETLDYSYNIRGWLTGINRGYANPLYTAEASAQSNRWFGMQLSYDYGFTANEVNGNISGTIWRSKGDGQQRAYGFDYDAANRILKADFTENAGSNTWNTNAGIDFTTKGLTYDANGNIFSMKQMGLKLNASSLIDDLVYGYTANSNKLSYVTDAANDTSAHLGDFTEINNNASADYSYDGNGSLTKDNNKGISSISYNYLNLPGTIKISDKGTITYTYDATGVKWRKTVVDSLSSKQVYTTYVGGFTYESNVKFGGSYSASTDTLQFIAQEEGRIRPKSPGNQDTMFYDYFIKDHLGNVRVVLTDAIQQDVYPAAIFENNAAALAIEKDYYDIMDANIVDESTIPSFTNNSANNYNNNNGNPPYNNNPSANTEAASTRLYKLNGSQGTKSGLGVVLKVMSGDIVDIFAKSYYHLNTGQTATNTYTLTSALSSLISVFAGSSSVAAGSKGITAAALNSSAATTTPYTNILNSMPDPGSTKPKAYINWILFDEQFRPVSGGSGFDPVNQNSDILKNHQKNVSINKSGYLYVYCSNESDINVFFDNLQVIHTRGPLLEETHYYPFGLTMGGISSKALNFGNAENKRKFDDGAELENKEFSDGTGLEIYETPFRGYDPQIGRFNQIDPLAVLNQSSSPYSYCENNPVNFIDPLGLDTLKRNADGTLPTVRPDGSKLQENDVILNGDDKGIASTYNGEGWQETNTLQGVTVTATKPKQNNNSGNNSNAQNNGNGSSASNFHTWDPATDRRITQLDPRIQLPTITFINRVCDELGISLRVAQGLRTIQEQDNLYSQGRTRAGPVVTNARGGQSYHNFGLAIDVYIIQPNGAINYDQQVPPAVVDIARQEGFEWGGNWRTFKDYPHFQMTFGQTLQQLRNQRGIHH